MAASVMVVDDSALVRMRLRQALGAAGFHVVEAVDGEDAWEKLTVATGLMVLVCDVNMPRLNGIELLERMSENGLMDRFPVLMLTTEGQPDLIQRARAIGARGWIIKPFKPDLVVAAVQRLATLA